MPNPRTLRRVAILTTGALTIAGLSAAVALQPGTEPERITSPVQRPARPRLDRTTDRGGPAGPAEFPNEFRTIDGVGNNAANSTWGAAAIQLLRVTPVAYADGIGTPAGPARPSARLVSNAVASQLPDMPNPERASDYLWQWGQFIDHDIDETPVTSPSEHFDVSVPTGDAFFDPDSDGGKVINLDRSAFDPNDPTRQQLNNITSFLDASNVYGADPARADALRANDGTGRLKTSAGDLLPYNTGAFDNAPTGADPSFFLAGDIRANEQIGLTSMHTLFMREHNFQADKIRAANPAFTDEQIYQRARAIVGAELQAITYREFLPLLLGPGALPPYQGYDPSVNASISNVFATAAYRVGHTMLSGTILRLGSDNQEAPEGNIPLLAAFFRPAEIEQNNIDSVLRGLAGKPAQSIDCQVVDDVRNFLFGTPGAGGFDLAALNIQRGRDHGLASYNQVRTTFGLPAVTTFAEINPNPDAYEPLADTYTDPDQIDAWIGMLAEPHRPGALVGETVFRVLRDQFQRMRDGDRFWYESYLPPELVDQVNDDTLSVIIRRNSNVGPELSNDVFRAPPPACIADVNADGLVDILDFAVFAGNFATSDPQCDFNLNGIVDIFDFAVFAQQFGTACPN